MGERESGEYRSGEESRNYSQTSCADFKSKTSVH